MASKSFHSGDVIDMYVGMITTRKQFQKKLDSVNSALRLMEGKSIIEMSRDEQKAFDIALRQKMELQKSLDYHMESSAVSYDRESGSSVVVDLIISPYSCYGNATMVINQCESNITLDSPLVAREMSRIKNEALSMKTLRCDAKAFKIRKWRSLSRNVLIRHLAKRRAQVTHIHLFYSYTSIYNCMHVHLQY